MAQRGKSKLWPWLVGLNGAIKNPLSPVASGLIELEQCWEQIDHAKETQQIAADVQAIRKALEETPDDQLAGELRELGMLSGLSPEGLRKIVRRRARALGLVSDEERLAEYRDWVVRQYTYADFRGIAQTATIVSMPLDEVFVPLSASPEEAVQEGRQEERELLARLEAAPDKQERTELEARLSEVEGRGFLKGVRDRAIGMAQVVRQDQKVVVLGDPGSGKTTFVKWLARQCAKGPEAMQEAVGWPADLVPVVVPVAAYGAALEKDASLRLREHIRRELDRDEGDGFGHLILERMGEGGCLVLLDGLDEIPDAGVRLAAARGVNDLMARCPKCRYLVTSRVVGYSVCRLSGDVAHYVLRGFTDDEIRQFARQWAEAYERASHPEAPDLEGARREADELTEAIFDASHPQVVEFARNPLLLTILALIKRQGVRLPERRVELYEVALKTLMESWVLGRSLARTPKGVELDVGQSLRVWQRVAYWMHREKPTGTAHATELATELAQALVEEEGLGEKEAEATAESFLTAAAERTGLLQARGENVFGFLHQTFQEYLAARHVARPPHTAFERVGGHLHDPRWREVILLAAGYIGQVLGQPEYAGEYVESIRKAGSQHENLLHRDLLLAAECLAERTPVDRRAEDGVLGGVCATLAAADAGGAEIDVITRVAARLGHVRPTEEKLMALLALAGHEDWRMRYSAMALLEGARGDEAEQAVRVGLRDSDDDVAGRAAAVLARAGVMDSDTLGGLATGLQRTAAYRTELKRLVSGRAEEIAAALVARLWDEDAGVRRGAAAALGAVGVKDAAVVEELVARLGDESAFVRGTAAEMLGALEVKDAGVVEGLVARLGDESAFVRMSAASVLEALGVKDAALVGRLVALLGDGDAAGRRSAAAALGALGVKDAEVVEGLVARLGDGDAVVRERAASALGALGVKDAEVVEGLVARLGDGDAVVRGRAAQALGELGVKEAEVVGGLVARLGDEEAIVRMSAAEALVALGVKEAEVVGGLVTALGEEDAYVRRRAAEALGRLCPLPSDAVDTLRALVEDEGKDRNMRYWAAELIVQSEESGR